MSNNAKHLAWELVHTMNTDTALNALAGYLFREHSQNGSASWADYDLLGELSNMLHHCGKPIEVDVDWSEWTDYVLDNGMEHKDHIQSAAVIASCTVCDEYWHIEKGRRKRLSTDVKRKRLEVKNDGRKQHATNHDHRQ